MNAKTILTAAALAAAFVTGAAQAATGEAYGYTYRVTDARSTFTDGARVNDQRSPFTDGARVGKADPYTDGARIVAGLDRTGVSATPARSADPYLDGARQGKFDPFTDGARVGKTDPYTDGARTVAGLDRVGVSASPARKVDPYLDGARGNAPRNPFYDGARQFDVFTDGANV